MVESGAAETRPLAEEVIPAGPIAGWPAGASSSAPATRRVIVTIAVLTLCHGVVLASIQIFNILVDPIKASLHLSDFRLSLLQGVAFGALAALVALPAARQADRGKRRVVAMVGALLWSVGTAGCASATSFWPMFAGRALVGIGELCFLPAAIALLTSVVPKARTALAMGIFISGSTVGNAFAWFGGGWLLANWPSLVAHNSSLAAIPAWRAGFAIYALLGLLCAGAMTWVHDPHVPPPMATQIPLREEARRLIALMRSGGRSVIGVLVGMLLLSFGSIGVYSWLPTVFIRGFGLDYGRVGTLLGLSFIIACTAGAWLAGILGDRLRARGRNDAPLLILCGACVMCGASLVWIAMSRTMDAGVIAALAGALAFSTMTAVMAPLALTEVSPQAVRSQILSWQYVLMYLIPVGLAPTSVALVTEHVLRRPSAVGWSIAIVYIAATSLAILILLWCRRDYVRRYLELQHIGEADVAPITL